MDNDIPPLRPPDQMPPICNDRDLLAYWRALMGQLGFSERLLWLLFIRADGHAEPHVTQVAELPEYPDQECLDGLMDVCERVFTGRGEHRSVAILLSRPGSATVTGSDRAWAGQIVAAARRNDIAIHPVHLANDEQVRVLAPDDLIGIR